MAELSSWIVFPNNLCPSNELRELANAFDKNIASIDSANHNLKSNDVLEVVTNDLELLGYQVERGKRAEDLIRMPVLFGERGALEKEFYADAYQPESHIVLEVEAGRAVVNNQFLKDLFEACMMDDADYLCIAVRKSYVSGGVHSNDYERVCKFMQTLYASNRLQLPLKGVMVLGY